MNTTLILNSKKIEPKKNINNNIVKNNINQNNIKTNNSLKKTKEQTKKNIIIFDDNLENINFLDDDYEDQEPQNTTVKKTEFKEINNNKKNEKKISKGFLQSKNPINDIKCNNKIIIKETLNDDININNPIINNQKQNNSEKIKNPPKKRVLKKPPINKNKN